MRILFVVLVLVLALLAGGCSAARRDVAESRAPGGASKSTGQPAGSTVPNDRTISTTANPTGATDPVDNAQAAATPANRKIIKDAKLTLEVDQPEAAQQRITSITNNLGGFVLSTNAQRQDSESQGNSALTVTVVARVPADKFEAALVEMRATASRVQKEEQSGQDVTQEFVDLEARLRAQQALEAQYLEIMKQAKSVTEALEVQRALAEVRTEIERIQGRMRYLQNQSDLSTITVTLLQKAPILGTSGGFWASLKSAFNDGLWVATAILFFLVRAVLAMIPIIVLIFLPIGLIWWYLVRRWRRAWTARRLARQAMDRAVEADHNRDT
jgi:hypothetical protein